jgi:hypothetical protein
MSRRLSGFLADNSLDQLQRMLRDMQQTRERAQEDVQQMLMEERVVEEAMARKSKRRAPARKASGSDRAGSGSARLSRDQVLELVNRTFTGFFNSRHAVDAFAEEGIDVSGEAVRQHLRKLADDDLILREGKGFAPLGRNGGPRRRLQLTSPTGGSQEGGDQGVGLRAGSRLGAEQ